LSIKFVIFKLVRKAFIVHPSIFFQKNHANLWTFFELTAFSLRFLEKKLFYGRKGYTIIKNMYFRFLYDYATLAMVWFL